VTESNHPEPLPYRPLAPSGRRAVASTSLYTAALGEVELLAASTLVDVLDGVSWALLAAAGLTPPEARVVLAQLWVEPTGGTE
jgi:hypothetical protein